MNADRLFVKSKNSLPYPDWTITHVTYVPYALKLEDCGDIAGKITENQGCDERGV